MRRLKVSALRPGMRLGMPVYGSRGLLLREGIDLTPAHIDRLRQERVEAVYIDDPLFADVHMPPDVSWEVKGALLSACSALWDHFRSLGGPAEAGSDPALQSGAEAASAPLPALPEAIRWPLRYERLMEIAGALEDELRRVPVWAVQAVPGGGDGPVVHAVNTALMAACLARQAGVGGHIREVAVGGLLHDLGLAVLPARLHPEPDRVDPGDQRLLHAHPLLGVKLLRGQPASAYVLAAVAQHHERFDGSGYPQGLSGARLAIHGQLVGMADRFTRLVEGGLSRSEAWEYVVSCAGTEFDHRLVQAFAQVIPPYPLGTTVRLSTGEEGVVVGLATGLLTRPRVRLLRDASGEPLRAPVTYDLAETAQRNRVIVGEVDER